jgi:hypothetical protein
VLTRSFTASLGTRGVEVMEAREALEIFFSLPCMSAEGALAVSVHEGGGAAVPGDAGSGRGQMREYLRLPTTGGGFLLASLASRQVFTESLGDLPISRTRWKVAREVLKGLARVGLHRRLGLPQLSVFLGASSEAAGRDYSIQTGVPGGGQKLIVREHRGQCDRAAIWKVGQAGLPAQLVQTEAQALTWLNQQGTGALGPKLYGAGESLGASWIRMEELIGERPGVALGDPAERFTRQLASAAPQRRLIESSPWYSRVCAGQVAIEQAAPDVVARTRSALEQVVAKAGAVEMDFHPAHGDFTPWNTRQAGPELRAFDWEFFQPDAPLLFDHYHWIVQTSVLMRRASPDQVYRTVLDGVMRRQRSCELAKLHFAMYLIDVLVREELVFLQGRPDFPQVQWLLDSRLALLETCLGGPIHG